MDVGLDEREQGVELISAADERAFHTQTVRLFPHEIRRTLRDFTDDRSERSGLGSRSNDQGIQMRTRYSR
jgi:hypothetical protein